jgi:hypothetical protein
MGLEIIEGLNMEAHRHKGTTPFLVNVGETSSDFYTVIITRDEENNLYIKVTRSRPSGDTTLLNANIYDIRPLEVETISDIELRVNTGNVSEQDKVAINFIARLTRLEHPKLFDFLEGTRISPEEKELTLHREYTKEDVLLALLNKQVKEKLSD